MDELSAAESGPTAGMNDRIQALFSRAVEEQVSEQRQLANALTEVRVRLTLLAEEVRGATATDGDALGREIAQVGEDVRDQVARQMPVLERIDARLDAFAAFPAAVSALQDELAGLHGRLPAAGEIRDGMADLGARISRLDGLASAATQQQVAESTQGLAGALAVVTGRLETVDDIADSLVELHAGLGQLRERVEAGSTVARSDDDADSGRLELTGQVARLEDRLSALDARIEGVTQQLSALGALGQQVGDLHAAMSNIDLAEELADLRGQLGRLTDRMDVPASTPGPAAAPDLEALTALLTTEVRAATSASERRTQAHVDEAVLALADALLRRRPLPAAAPVDDLVGADELVGTPDEVQDEPPDEPPAGMADEGPGPVPVHRDESGQPAMAEPDDPADPALSSAPAGPAQVPPTVERPGPDRQPARNLTELPDARRRGLFRRREG
ncbi:MAG: hypothetical protein M3Z02_03665 [Actinomycetota bacterium]|nr:hypothetical protein [Actinomycetota bacterium]